jgi:hypothetical protein
MPAGVYEGAPNVGERLTMRQLLADTVNSDGSLKRWVSVCRDLSRSVPLFERSVLMPGCCCVVLATAAPPHMHLRIVAMNVLAVF